MHPPSPAHESIDLEGPSIDRLLGSDRPGVIAHRGFSARAPENTLPAIEAAIEAGVDMIEIDVQLSRDGELLVLHDARLGRTVRGTGRVADLDAATVRALDAGSWFASADPSTDFTGAFVPTLDEVLAACRGRVLLNIEIKREAVRAIERDSGVATRVVDAIRRHDATRWVIVSSFDARPLRRIARRAPDIPLAVLFDRRFRSRFGPWKLARAVGARAIHLSRRRATDRRLRRARREGLYVGVYTVNVTPHMDRLLSRGVDALFSDRPDRLQALIDGRHDGRPRRRRAPRPLWETLVAVALAVLTLLAPVFALLRRPRD